MVLAEDSPSSGGRKLLSKMNRRLELPNLSTENSCLWLKLLPDPIACMRAILLDKTSRSSLFSRFGGCPPCLGNTAK